MTKLTPCVPPVSRGSPSIFHRHGAARDLSNQPNLSTAAPRHTNGVPKQGGFDGNVYNPDQFISAQELAKRIFISVKGLEAMRSRGDGPKPTYIGRRVRYRWGDVLDWLEGMQ